MKSLKLFAAATCFITLSSTANALDVGENDFAWASELAEAGFKPFAVSSTAKASFGMMREMEMYMCFLADNKEDQAVRREKLLANMQDAEASRTLPNIPLACVLVQ